MKREDIFQLALEQLCDAAERYGVVLEIQNIPRRPLAMGNHRMRPSARLARRLEEHTETLEEPNFLGVLVGDPKSREFMLSLAQGHQYLDFRMVNDCTQIVRFP